MLERIIFHIDMNAFFASVAQQANPLLRGKPIGVGGKPGTRSIIAAASYEAKRLGVKSIMNSYEALKIAPNLIIVDGDNEAYIEANHRFVTIFKRYTHLVEVFSIDECWLDMTGYAKSYEHARELAIAIKEDMRRELGECITCSIGIAPNKLLAKLASDKEKPNGLYIIRPSSVSVIMKTTKPNELLGIGPRVSLHMERLGLKTNEQIAEAPDNLLENEFGILGAIYKLITKGIDESPVISISSTAKSVGNSYTMPLDSADSRILKPTLFAICEKVARRLRRDGLLARQITTWGRYKNFEGSFRLMRTLDAPTFDAKTLLETSLPIIMSGARSGPIRALGITTHNLISSTKTPLPLWTSDRKRIIAASACDKINNHFGERTIKPASLLGTRLNRHVSGFKP
ncbi:MAG: DNA polymerase IV [bacterium]